MNDALVFLTWRTLFNGARLKTAQLRNPRYAVAFVLGAALLWFFVGRRPPAPTGSAATVEQHRELAMAILASWAVAWTWAFGSRRVALTFSLAEADFLFPSPVSRRALIRFKLFHAQGRVLWTTLIWTLVLSRTGPAGLALLHAIGAWALLSTLQLHRLGASFTRAAVAEHGRAGLARQWVTLTVVVASAAAVIGVLGSLAPAVATASARGVTLFDALVAAARAPLAHALLAPFRLLVRAVAANDAGTWGRAILPALAILAAHFVWVMRSDASFEESAAEAARRRAEQLASRGAGSMATGATVAEPIFRLGARGAPAVAIFWKNLVAVARLDRARRVLGAFLLVSAAVGALSVLRIGRIAPVIGALAGTWAVFSVLIGPQWVRNDLRTDLLRLELLRSYPVSGAEVVAAEVAASAAVVTLMQLMLAIVTYCAFLGDSTLPLSGGARLLTLLAAGALLPAVNYLGMGLLNGGALLYPAWVRIGPGRAAGVEGLGQNVLSMAAYGLALLTALTPPAIIAAGVVWALGGLMNVWAWLPAAVAGIGVIALECRLLIPLLGRVLEGIDLPSSGIESA